MADDNFGTILLLGNLDGPPETFSAIGTIRSIEPPGLNKDPIEVTHQTSTAKEFIASPTPEIQEFVVTFYTVEADYTVLNGLLGTGASRNWQVQFPDAADMNYQFAAMVRGLKAVASDATSPDALTVDATFRPTGAMTYTHS